MHEWKFKIGEIVGAKESKHVITGYRVETCEAGEQFFYLAYPIFHQWGIGFSTTLQASLIPEKVMEAMSEMMKEGGK